MGYTSRCIVTISPLKHAENHVTAGSADVRESGMPNSPERSTNAFRSGNERLYEAYNDLHSLAQDFEKPFDAPAILVVGHQTDGKSGGLFAHCSHQRERM